MICQRRVFLLNNVYFDQKISIFVLKYPSLSKRRMGQAAISCFNWVADILDKDHQKPKGKTKNNRTPSLCKKGLGRLSRHSLGVLLRRWNFQK